MLITSLIFLLLSNSITLRRDKSILYSRATITILLIFVFIAYDYQFFLFLNKGIGTLSGLLSSTATTNSFHIFIFLISAVILLLTVFYLGKLRLQYSLPAKLLHIFTQIGANPIKLLHQKHSSEGRFSPNIMQSSANSFFVKLGPILLICYYSEDDYNNLLSLYDSASIGFNYLTDAFSNLTNFSSAYSYPSVKNGYNNYLTMQDLTFTLIKTAANNYVYNIGFVFSPISFARDMLEFHTNLALAHSMQRLVGFVLGTTVLVLGVNIHLLVKLLVRLVDFLYKLAELFRSKASSYYDPVRDKYVPSQQNSQSKTYITNSSSNVNTNNSGSVVNPGGSGGDDGDDRKENHKRKAIIDSVGPEVTLEELLLILEYIRNQIVRWRETASTDNSYESSIERQWYGIPRDGPSINRTVSLQQIIRYAIAHYDEISPLNIPLSSILSPLARSYMTGRYTVRSLLLRRLHGDNLRNSLVHSEELQSLMEGVNNLEGNALLIIWSRLVNQNRS